MTAPRSVKDSWAIAAASRRAPIRRSRCSERDGAHLRAFRQRLGRHRGARRAVPDGRRRSLRSRAAGGQGLFRRVARQAAGHDRLRRLPGQGAREGRRGVPRRARAGAARPEGADVPVRRRSPPIPTTSWPAPSCGPRIVSPLELLEADDPVYAWRERMLDLFDGMGRKAQGCVKYDAVIFDLLTALIEFLDLVERRRGLARRRHEMAPALSRDHLRLRPLQTL